MSESVGIMKEREGRVYYGLTVAYVLIGYTLGLAGLFHSLWIVNIVAVLILAHAMTIAAYMIHECGHNLVFRRIAHNAVLGKAMSWICGAAYGTYEDMRYKHFRHHVDNDDVVWFDYDAFFERHPIVTRVTRLLEWVYIPAHDLIMHFVMVFTSFFIPQRRDQRVRNIVVIVVRGGLFGAALIFVPKLAALYVLAYLIMMHILRFVDSVQHDYPYSTTLFTTSNAPHKGDTEWEQEHTFSNVISMRYPMLNLLALNFGYHNAHHANMNLPFYRLPEKHAEMTGNAPESVIPLWSQLKLYHHNRVARIHNPQPTNYPKGEAYLLAARQGAGRIGGNAASFLTSF